MQQKLSSILHKYCPGITIIIMLLSSWRCSSVVWMSVFGWRTYLDLWLTGDHHVGKLFAMDLPAKPTRPSIPPRSVFE